MMIILSKKQADQIRQHGSAAYPGECCGILGGTVAPDGARRVVTLFPAINQRTDSLRRFLIDPQDILRATRELEKRGLEVLGFYHSHPDAPSRPSEFDRQHAWHWYSYLIVSVQRGVPAEMESWQLADDGSKFVLEKLQVDMSGANASENIAERGQL